MTPRERKGPRLFVEGLRERGVLLSGASLTLPSSESHYVRDVLRLPVGAALEIGDPSEGKVFKATIASLTDGVMISILEQIPDSTSDTAITLLCALCKGQKNDQICDWATELGCSRIIFWQADRSIVRLKNESDGFTKAARLQKIATAAAQQSRQVKPPVVHVETSLQRALAHLESDASPLNIYCSLEYGVPPLHEVATSATARSHINIFVGPEGDLTTEESSTLAEKGFLPVSLGPNVLRSELAAITALISMTSATR